MAGGDHLHYEVMVSGQPVNPIEWWDAHWLKDNITGKLAMATGISVKEVTTKVKYAVRTVKNKGTQRSRHKKRTP
jgi:hypothetical protein